MQRCSEKCPRSVLCHDLNSRDKSFGTVREHFFPENGYAGMFSTKLFVVEIFVIFIVILHIRIRYTFYYLKNLVRMVEWVGRVPVK